MHYKINSESQSLISEPIDFTAIRMKAREKRRFCQGKKKREVENSLSPNRSNQGIDSN